MMSLPHFLPLHSPTTPQPAHTMRTLVWTAVCGVTLLLLTACGGAATLSPSHVTFSPQPPTLRGGIVPVELTVRVPPHAVPRKALVTFTPCLFWDEGGLLADSLTVQGERVEGMNQIVSYKRGAIVRLQASFPYRKGMEEAALVLHVETRQGEQSTDTDLPLDTGINCTQALMELAISTMPRSESNNAYMQAGLQAMKQGRMAVAAAQFDHIGGNCAFLANILAQNYAQADYTMTTLDPNQPLTAYLTALLGVRMNNEELLRKGLHALENSDYAPLKKQVKHDLEFEKVSEIVDEIVK